MSKNKNIVSSLLLGTALVAALPMMTNAALAQDHTLPQGEQVIGGAASFDRNVAGRLDVHQSTDRAVIEWQSFNIGRDATTQFHQPSTSSLTVNRVVSGNDDPSRILGTLSANGQVMVLDRNGVLFGEDSIVNVGGIIASTGQVNTAQVMSGATKIDITNLGEASSIENRGSITVSEGGMASFVAPHVSNKGVIAARMGRVVLASGASTATVDLYGDGLVEMAIDERKAKSLSVNNTGSIQADGGVIVMTTARAEQIVDSVINVGGLVSANSVSSKDGKIIIGGSETGSVSISGRVQSNNTVSGQAGYIGVTADHLRVKPTAIIEAKGRNGGGTVELGGGLQGQGTLANAQNALVEQGAIIDVSAIENGDGGTAIIWADDTLEFGGYVYATGGAFGGNGGFVETSGKDTIEFLGEDFGVNVSAPSFLNDGLDFTGGTWLIDPTDITIGNTLASSLVSTMNLGGAGVVTTASTDSQQGTIHVNTDIRWTGAGSLSLIADNHIVLRSKIRSSYVGGTGSEGAITLNAQGSIMGNYLPRNREVTTQSGDITFISGETIALGGASAANFNMKSEFGDISLTATDDIFLGGTDSNGGNWTRVSAQNGDLTINAGKNFTARSGTQTNSFVEVLAFKGAVNITAGNDAIFDGKAADSEVRFKSGDRMTVTAQNGSITIGEHVDHFMTGDRDRLKLDAAKRLDIASNLTTTRGAMDFDAHEGIMISSTLNTQRAGINIRNRKTGAVSTVKSEGIDIKATANLITDNRNIVLRADRSNLYVGGNLNADRRTVNLRGSNIELADNGQITSGTFRFNTGGSITQSSAGHVINTRSLRGSAGDAITLNNSNNGIRTIGRTTAENNIAIKDSADGLQINRAISSNSGTVSIESAGARGQNLVVTGRGEVNTNGGKITLKHDQGVVVNGRIDATSPTSDGAIEIDAASVALNANSYIAADNALGAATGTLELKASTGAVTQDASGYIVAATLSGTSGENAELLGSFNDIGGLGNFATGTSAIHNGGMTLVSSASDLDVTGSVTTTGGHVDIDMNQGSISIAKAGVINANGGNIDLSQRGTISSDAANTIRTRSAGNITLQQNAGGTLEDVLEAIDNTGVGTNTITLGAGNYVENGETVIDDRIRLIGSNNVITKNVNTNDWFTIARNGRLHMTDLTFDGAGFDTNNAFMNEGRLIANNVSFQNMNNATNNANAVRINDGYMNIRNATFTDNNVGLAMFGGDTEFAADLASANTFTGGNIAMIADGNTATIVNETLAHTKFDGQSDAYIRLSNNAFQGEVIDGMNAEFDGFIPQNNIIGANDLQDLANYERLENRFTDFNDIASLGDIYIGTAPGLSEGELDDATRSIIGSFDIPESSGLVTVNGLPPVSFDAPVDPGSALNALSPDAGDEAGDDLNAIEPAAGPSSDNEDAAGTTTACWGNFSDVDGQTVTYTLSSTPEDLMNEEGC